MEKAGWWLGDRGPAASEARGAGMRGLGASGRGGWRRSVEAGGEMGDVQVLRRWREERWRDGEMEM